jgi:hypothetical protein
MSSEQFSREILKVVVVKVCQSFGVTRIEPQALCALTDILIACAFLLRVLILRFALDSIVFFVCFVLLFEMFFLILTIC